MGAAGAVAYGDIENTTLAHVRDVHAINTEVVPASDGAIFINGAEIPIHGCTTART